MEPLVEFAKIILPAGAVLYAMFLTMRMFIRKEYDHKVIDIRNKNTEIVLPLRLQAYERICLFLERANPKNLVVRLSSADLSAAEFQQILISEVRDEFGHNLSQQVYVSVQAWEMVKNGMEEVIMLINESAASMTDESKSIDLARQIFDKIIERQHLAVDSALSFIKEEVQQTF